MIFDLWDSIDETKDELTGGIAGEVLKAPLDQAQAGLIMLIGILITWVSVGYFPIGGFHIASFINLGIGLVLFIVGFIWWGWWYA